MLEWFLLIELASLVHCSWPIKKVFSPNKVNLMIKHRPFIQKQQILQKYRTCTFIFQEDHLGKGCQNANVVMVIEH